MTSTLEMAATPGFAPTLRIATRCISAAPPAYVIAEAGVNHDGDVEQARALIDIAADTGADAVKFQIFTADALTAEDAPLAGYQQSAAASSQSEMLRKLELTENDFAALAAHAERRGIAFIATPFSVADVRTLQHLDPPAIKIASTDLGNLPLLRAAAALGKPLLVSTGAATLAEIDRAVRRFEEWGVWERVVLFHCVSAYPTPDEAANLGAIRTLRERFGGLVGYSDHTRSTLAGALAAAAGACIIEKHFTRDRSAAGPDHAMSLDPGELSAYIAGIRSAEQLLGQGRLGYQPIEADVRRVAGRSVVAASDLRSGTQLTACDLCVKRPAGGIAPDRFDELVGRTLTQPLRRNQRLDWSHLS